MRCESCGRPIKNAQMWQLGGNINAPQSRSLQQLCWDCRRDAETNPNLRAVTGILADGAEQVQPKDADLR